jgi:hypothetical protein
MLSALVSLPKGTSRDRLVKELRRLGVRLEEWPETGPFPEWPRGRPVDFIVVGSGHAHAATIQKLLRARRPRPPVIMLKTSGSSHGSSRLGGDVWCLHVPLRPCVLSAYVRSIEERKKALDRLARLLASSKGAEQHEVDDLWFKIFEQLKRNAKK